MITPLIKYRSRSKWINTINNWKDTYRHKYIPAEYKKIKTQQFLEKLNKYVRDKDAICTTGVGNHQMMSCQFINWKFPKQIISSGSLGVMGVALPYAIGAQIANPKKTIVSIDGDSSFMMTFGDLKTVIEHKLPIKIFICNNHTQDMVRVWENLFFEDRITATTNSSNPDFTNIANSFGITSLSCNNIDTLDSTIEYAMKYKGPILCEIKTVPDYCLPLVAPGKALDDMILLDDTITSLEGEAPC